MSTPPEEIEMGEPIEQLASLEHAPERDLGGRVVRAIERRLMTGDVLELGFTGLASVVLEYLDAFMSALGGSKEGKNG